MSLDKLGIAVATFLQVICTCRGRITSVMVEGRTSVRTNLLIVDYLDFQISRLFLKLFADEEVYSVNSSIYYQVSSLFVLASPSTPFGRNRDIYQHFPS